MKLQIKATTSEKVRIEEVVKKIRAIEKEYSCNCTLLEISENILNPRDVEIQISFS